MVNNGDKKTNGHEVLIDELFTSKRLERADFNGCLAPRICRVLKREGITTVAQLKEVLAAKNGELHIAHFDGLRGESLAAIKALLKIKRRGAISFHLPRLPR